MVPGDREQVIADVEPLDVFDGATFFAAFLSAALPAPVSEGFSVTFGVLAGDGPPVFGSLASALPLGSGFAFGCGAGGGTSDFSSPGST